MNEIKIMYDKIYKMVRLLFPNLSDKEVEKKTKEVFYRALELGAAKGVKL